MMSFQPDSRYGTIAVYVLLVILFTLLCVFVGLYFTDIAGGIVFVLNTLKPVIYGLVMAFLLGPAQRFFEERVFAFIDRKSRHKLKRALSLVLTYLAVAAGITLFAVIIIPRAMDGYRDLEAQLPGYIAAAGDWIERAVDRFIPLPFFFGDGAADIIKRMIDDSYDLFSDLTPHVIAALMNLVTETKNIALGLVISLYYLASRRAIEERVRFIAETLLPAGIREGLGEIAGLANQCFLQFVCGKLIDAAILGLLCFVFMSLFGMPYAPLVGLLVGVTNVIPYIGPFLGAVPGAFIIFLSDHTMTVWFILLIIILQQIDFYIIEPHILRTRVSLDSVWIMVSVVFMGGLLGPFGMFIGVPVFAIIYALIKRHAEERLRAKGLSVIDASPLST